MLLIYNKTSQNDRIGTNYEFKCFVCFVDSVYLNAWFDLSKRWHLDASKPILTVSPTFIFESPSTSTTNGSSSFSIYKNVPEPSFSTTKTFPSQLASPSLLTKICSGLIPSLISSPSETFPDILGTLNLDELNNLLDARYPTPLPKVAQKQADSTDGASASTSSTREYDALIIKATCYICASNLIRSKDPMSEEADYYYNLVTNAERTGIVDRLNAGEFKLSYEVDNKDSEGAITKITQSGASSMELVETAGQGDVQEISLRCYQQRKVLDRAIKELLS